MNPDLEAILLDEAPQLISVLEQVLAGGYVVEEGWAEELYVFGGKAAVNPSVMSPSQIPSLNLDSKGKLPILTTPTGKEKKGRKGQLTPAQTQ